MNTGAALRQVMSMWCCQVHPERCGLCSLGTKDRRPGGWSGSEKGWRLAFVRYIRILKRTPVGWQVWKGSPNLSLIQFWPIRNGFIGTIPFVWRGYCGSHRKCGEIQRSYPNLRPFAGSRDHLKMSQQLFQLVGAGSPEKLCLPGGQGVVHTTWKGWRMRFNWDHNRIVLLLMAEILHHMGSIKSCK